MLFQYKVSGSLSANHPSYIERKADKELYNCLKNGDFCYVFNSRQMGKSSLRVRTTKKLQDEGFTCIDIDMSLIGSPDTTENEFYGGIISYLDSELNTEINLRKWWDENNISPVLKLSKFINDVFLPNTSKKIVIFIEEIDSILRLKFPIDEFFNVVRYCYNQRSQNPDYNRLSFVFIGVTSPYDLIKDKHNSPFDVAKPIELQGFTFEEAKILTQGFPNNFTHPEDVLKQILNYTDGQPLLTQKLCKLVANCQEDFTPNLVKNIVKAKIIEKWESQDEPQHLRTLRDRILMSKKARLLLEIYQNILELGEIPYLDIPEHLELRLTGVVINHQGKLKVYNNIYSQVFDLNWVNEQLDNIQQIEKNQIKQKAIAIVDGRYALIKMLSQSTFTEIYKGIDLHFPNERFVVVKKFINNVSNKHRFLERESNILSQLDHPNLPEILAYFAENNQFYIVSEYIEGRTLAEDLTKKRSLSENEVIDILKDVLETLKFIHSNNVIHRNLEPDNLIIRESYKKIALIDFGTAKISQNERSSTIIFETKGYNPPEQIYSNANFTSDIYALGMIAIQCLTDIAPFDLPINQNSEVIWREYAKVSNELGDIIDKMVRYDYRERYQSVDEVLANLDHGKTEQISINNRFYLPKLKLNNWAKWILISGGVLSLFVICFMTGSKNNKTSPLMTHSQIETEKNPPQNYLRSPEKEEIKNLKEKEEKDIQDVIRGWSNAKKTIFAYPYNLEEAKKWNTNKRYNKMKNFVKSAKINHSYYKFEKVAITFIKDSYESKNNQAQIEAIIEQKFMVDNNKVSQQKNYVTKKIRYTLKLVNKSWKIDDEQVIQQTTLDLDSIDILRNKNK